MYYIFAHVIYDYSREIIEQTSGATVGGPISFLKHATNIQEDKISDKDGELSLLQTSLLSMAAGRYVGAATAGAGSDYQAASSEGAKKTALEGQKITEETHRTMFQFLIEAIVLCMIGCAIGIFLSWSFLRLVSVITASLDLSFNMNGAVVIVAVTFCFFIGVVFGLYPANKAAKMKPIDALHYSE